MLYILIDVLYKSLHAIITVFFFTEIIWIVWIFNTNMWIDWKIKEHLQANVNPTMLVDPHYVTEPIQWVLRYVQ